MIVIGIDQAERSGWGIAQGRHVIEHGVAWTHPMRRAVLERASELNGGTLRGVLVMFEDHAGMPLSRLTSFDRTTERHGRPGAPERTTGSILGQGASKGRWLELLDMLGHPKALRDKVKPHVWRNKLGISCRRTDAAKLGACQVASAAVNAMITDHDEAEGIAITLYAAIEGAMRAELVRKARQHH